MKNMLLTTLFMLATLGWAAAQQTSSAPDQSGGQATSPSAQTQGMSPAQNPTAPTAQAPGTGAAQSPTSPSQGGAAVAQTVTEGCLGGSNPNYTITSSAGTTYKLNIPPTADTSKLAAHVGESVNVAGNVNDTGSPSIDVRGIGKGAGTCPAGGSKTTQPPPKQ